MEQKIIELLRRVFEGIEINESSSNETVADWDSMHQLNIAFEIETSFGVSIEPEEYSGLTSVKNIADFLSKKNCHGE